MKKLDNTGRARAIRAMRIFGLLALLPLLGSCSSHYDRYAVSGLQPIALENGLSKKEDASFWAGVKPLSTLPEAHYKLGRYYQKSGKHQLAIEEFLKAIKLNTKYVQAYNGLGMAYDALKDCAKAQKAYTTALIYASKFAYLFNNYGYSRLLCNDPDLAIRLFKRAAELDPATARIRNNLLLAELRSQHRIPETHRLSGAAPPPQPVERRQPAVSHVPTPRETPAEPVTSRPPAPIQAGSATQEAVAQSRPAESPPPAIKLHNVAIASTRAKAPVQDHHDDAVPVGVFKMAALPVIAPGKYKKYPAPVAHPESRDLSLSGIEISNGNGVSGMAGRSADFFRIMGFVVGRITNARHFNYQTSRIYYIEGFLDIAKAVAGIVPGPQEFEEVDDLGHAGIGVRLLLGRDMAAIRFPNNLAGLHGNGEIEERVAARTVAVH